MSTSLDALLQRRSIYSLGSTIPVTDTELEALLGKIILNMPTAFNMQSTRMVLLLGEKHQRLWQLVLATLQSVTPEDKFPQTHKKIDSFAAGHGTILYFDDTGTTHDYASRFATYRDLFPDWALQQNGMLQYAVWTALAERGIGASLQHYNPIIDAGVADLFELPESWRLLAQMPFGSITSPPEDKTFLPLQQRLQVLGG